MNDNDPASVKTYQRNFEAPGGEEDILKALKSPENIPFADVVIGGAALSGV
jgi:site-specific DNA-cytosine methylase